MTMQDGFGRFIVEYNDIEPIGLEIADTGGIMVNRWFVHPDDPELSAGGLIRFNLIRNCVGCGAYSEQRHPKGEGDRTTAGGRIWTPYYTWGVYFDNSGMDNTVFGNIVVATVLGRRFAAGGRAEEQPRREQHLHREQRQPVGPADGRREQPVRAEHRLLRRSPGDAAGGQLDHEEGGRRVRSQPLFSRGRIRSRRSAASAR